MSVGSSVTLWAGKEGQRTAKWSPEEVERMDRQQLLEALREALDFAVVYDAEYARPLSQAMVGIEGLEIKAKDKTMDFLSVFGIVLGAAVGVVGIEAILEKTPAFGVMMILAGAAIAAVGVREERKQRGIREKFSFQSAEVEMLQKAALDFRQSQAGADAYALWPEGYTDPAAIRFAIDAIEDRRVQTLDRAAELWEWEKRNKVVMARLEKQVRARYEAIVADRQAATVSKTAAGYPK